MEKYENEDNKFMILDNRKNLKLKNKIKSFNDLLSELSADTRVNDLEKCVILYQMGSLVGNDIYKTLESSFDTRCDRNDSIDFLRKNASYVNY